MKRIFTEEEVKHLVWNEEVERENGENRRWTRNVTSIVEVDGKFYALDWEEGLTEGQENLYFDQESDEVELVETTKTITVKEWVPVGAKR